ncbi:MAG TPA: exodeoxyribonuclease I [Candidatus Saccharibacteria bacterium]|nr:exodeoxyribonuclease I [Candidatus Saccharibacteria bacterium]
MTQTFFFYDLETSGLSARDDRIMQFAGQRTDMDFNPIGEPVNELIRLNDDILPSPEALFVTGITPQQTVADGYSEAEFARMVVQDIFTPGTIAVGFNNIRFDDEFMRHILWRNFYDPYEWTWRDGRSRWDILDVVRMTRALRPEGIQWPVTEDGKATNRLELLTKLNGVDHYKAHDALSDVMATIEVAKLIHGKQPQLFDYLLKLRDKREVMNLVNLDDKRPFVYTSGRYDAEHEKTTVAFPLTVGRNGNVVVYDLRYDPTPLVNLDQKQLAAKVFAGWEERKAEDFVKVPVKELQYNRVPAVAPLGVLEQEDSWSKIHLDIATIEKHKKILLGAPHFAENIRSVLEGRPEFKKSADPEAQLYDGFVGDRDKIRIETVRNASERELVDFHPQFDDERLSPLLLHYKARNYPNTLSESEVAEWESWRSVRIGTKLAPFMASLAKLTSTATDSQQFILQELQLWAESIAPMSDD